jgi:hypothetical protein
VLTGFCGITVLKERVAKKKERKKRILSRNSARYTSKRRGKKHRERERVDGVSCAFQQLV